KRQDAAAGRETACGPFSGPHAAGVLGGKRRSVKPIERGNLRNAEPGKRGDERGRRRATRGEHGGRRAFPRRPLAGPGPIEDPTRVSSQPAANSRISARVYSRCTVASVPSTETRLVRDAAHAGLIAGTVPTKGSANRARKLGSMIVEAVLQAMTTRSGSSFA